MTKIVVVDQQCLSNPCIPVLPELVGHPDWKPYQEFLTYNQNFNGFYHRAGVNNLPFKNDLIQHFHFEMPTYDDKFNLSFAEVSDLRIADLTKNKQDKPWLVMYSGGIDSTVIMAAILKNLSPANFENITVACNQLSVIEYPSFFYNYIKPNFKIIDSTYLAYDSSLYDQYYVLDGELGDMLYGAVSWLPDQVSNQLLLKDFRQEPDALIALLNEIKGPGLWFYELLKENIDSVDVPVTNYIDFFWWMNINMCWASALLRPHHQRGESLSVDKFLQNNISWYDSREYQLWSMTTSPNEKYSTDIALRKLASKKYIYDLDHNKYYYHFKCKSMSVGRSKSRHRREWFCLTDDGPPLYIEQDLEKILDLLPEHINQQY